MTLYSTSERQSSDSWQEGVRLENRLRRVEEKIEDLERRIWWFYVLLTALCLLVAGTFIHK
jgi:hypothetical protein